MSRIQTQQLKYEFEMQDNEFIFYKNNKRSHNEEATETNSGFKYVKKIWRFRRGI